MVCLANSWQQRNCSTYSSVPRCASYLKYVVSSDCKISTYFYSRRIWFAKYPLRVLGCAT